MHAGGQGQPLVDAGELCFLYGWKALCLRSAEGSPRKFPLTMHRTRDLWLVLYMRERANREVGDFSQTQLGRERFRKTARKKTGRHAVVRVAVISWLKYLIGPTSLVDTA